MGAADLHAASFRGDDLRRGGSRLVDGGNLGVFLAAAIIVGVITRMGEKRSGTFIDGAGFARRGANYWYRARHCGGGPTV